jgi:hypothetical protein
MTPIAIREEPSHSAARPPAALLALLVCTALALVALLFGGCACDETSRFAIGLAPFATAPFPAAPCAPQVATAPVQYAAAQPIGIQYRIGAAEYARAGLAIPGTLVVCAGNFLRCAIESFFPVLTPTARYVYAQPHVQYVPVQVAPWGSFAPPFAPASTAPCEPR